MTKLQGAKVVSAVQELGISKLSNIKKLINTVVIVILMESSTEESPFVRETCKTDAQTRFFTAFRMTCKLRDVILKDS